MLGFLFPGGGIATSKHDSSQALDTLNPSNLMELVQHDISYSSHVHNAIVATDNHSLSSFVNPLFNPPLIHRLLSLPFPHPLPSLSPRNLLRPFRKRLRNLRLPRQPILSVNLRRDRERLAALEEARADDDLGSQDRLVVVDVGGAVGAVVAVYWFACFREGSRVESVEEPLCN